MMSGKVEAKTVERLGGALHEYCRRDTWALLRLHQALAASAG
jgi:hypothetical protein